MKGSGQGQEKWLGLGPMVGNWLGFAFGIDWALNLGVGGNEVLFQVQKKVG